MSESSSLPAVVFTPEYLGNTPLDVSNESCYTNAVFLYLINGGISARDSGNLMPINDVEARDAERALTLCINGVSEARNNKDQYEYSTRKGLDWAHDLLRDAGGETNLFKNSHLRLNDYSNYYTKDGVRTLLKVPDGLRSFTERTRALKIATKEAIYETGERRFSTLEDLVSVFPGVNFAVLALSNFQQRILDYTYTGEGEVPEFLSAKKADEVISLLGGGTLIMALDSVNTETGIQHRIKKLAVSVQSSIGIGGFRATSMGRTAWGARSIRLRTGDTMPRVTLPHPGV